MAKTTVKPGNPNPSGMPSTTGNKSGGGRSNNPPKQTPSPKLQGGEIQEIIWIKQQWTSLQNISNNLV